MALDQKKIDAIVRERSDMYASDMGYTLRDQAELFPFKMRVTVFCRDATDGTWHMTECESLYRDTETMEEEYQDVLKLQAIREAKEIIAKPTA